MAKPLPVIAAIPNYNMADSLKELLPQVLEQGYDAVYVLDDASTDDSRQVVARFPDVVWVGGTHNIGAGGNRNRIFKAHPSECIIHFLDADVRLETEGIADKARKLMADPNTAFVGGLVKEKGRQMIWNYGPALALHSSLTALIQTLFGNIQAPKPLWRGIIRKATRRARREWPDPASPPERRAVYWPVEANLLVRRSTLKKLGGFDGTIFEFDIIPPARKAYQLGMVSYFDPRITVTHLSIDVRHYHRNIALVKEQRRLIKRFGGWREWIFPEGRFKPRYNK